MRVLATCSAIAVMLVLAPIAGAASMLEISGGGDGHGIGMSQYGAYGYALHGKDYRFILAHYYQGTELGSTDPNQIVRVLIADGSAQFSGATAAGGQPLDPATTYAVTAPAGGSLSLQTTGGRRIGSFPAPP